MLDTLLLKRISKPKNIPKTNLLAMGKGDNFCNERIKDKPIPLAQLQGPLGK